MISLPADTDLFNYVDHHRREEALKWPLALFNELVRQKLQRYAINRRYRRKRNQGG